MNVFVQTNLADLETLWAQSPQVCTEELSISLSEALALMEREVIEQTPRGATSALRNMITTIQTVPAPLEGDLVGMVTGTAPHTVPVEMGSRPHFVPIAPLLDWVTAKLGKAGDEGRSIAYAIQQKIAKHGTRGAAMFRRSLQINNNEQRVERILQAAVPRILARLTAGGV